MPEAWRVRESQRQELFEDLKRRAFEKEEEEDGSHCFFLLLLSAAIARHLIMVKQRGSALNIIIFPWLFPESVSRFLTQEVLPKVKEFSRTETEADALLAKFLGEILQSGLNPFHAALMREEISNPQKIFHASSAMTKMSLEA